MALLYDLRRNRSLSKGIYRLPDLSCGVSNPKFRAPRLWAAALCRTWGISCYLLLYLRRKPDRPNKPLLSSAMLPGSGTEDTVTPTVPSP